MTDDEPRERATDRDAVAREASEHARRFQDAASRVLAASEELNRRAAR